MGCSELKVSLRADDALEDVSQEKLIHVPNREEELEVRSTKASLDSAKIVQEAREEAEERLLLEVGALLFVHVGKSRIVDGIL